MLRLVGWKKKDGSEDSILKSDELSLESII
jgi:hypothetical protein